MFNKLFVINKYNKYYKFINELYQKTLLIQPKSTYLQYDLNSKHFSKNTDVIITNSILSNDILQKLSNKNILFL